MIRLNRVNKYFNKKKSNEIHVIDNTSLELGNKGLVTFLGNSGCGKTTLLNAIGGLDNVDSGDIFIDDEKITTRSTSKRDEIRNINIGYIFQNYNLIEDATVFENVAIVLKMMGIKDGSEINERVSYILERVGIYKYRNRPAKMLSGGERQRVGIARAIVKNPKIIIADEPTGNLDSKNTIEIMNIIKAISKEKLVILVTHEKEIAEFYASRIIEIVDGKITSDKENVHNNDLDYRLDTKIYLKDMAVQKEVSSDNLKINFYGDEGTDDLQIKIVVKNNNIYVRTNKNLAEGASGIDLVDDHYKKISKDIYEDYQFDYDKLIDKNFKPKYTSIFNPLSLLGNGFRKVFSYSTIKKILLVGFMLASVFIIYSISNIAGITNITDDKFINVNHNYLTVTTGDLNLKTYNKYAKMEGIDYVLPGDSIIKMILPIGDYYQSYNRVMMLSGSMASTDLLEKNDIIEGSIPQKKKEIALDKLSIKKLLENNVTQQIGLKDYADFVGRKVIVPRLGEYTITGITDKNSPSIYVDRSQFINILANQGISEEVQYGTEINQIIGQSGSIADYNIAKREIHIEKGRKPENDYEALININHQYEVSLNETIDTKVNGKKLTVVGFYSNKRDDNTIYVNEDTVKYRVIAGSKNLVLSPLEKDSTLEKLSATNVKVTDNYAKDRENYIDGLKKKIIATIVVAGIILLISLIEIYLMLRSSFLSRVKEVGVLRSIGLKKKDIYKMFLGEIIAITTLTAVPAMSIMAYILNGISHLPFIGENYLMNPLVFLGSLLLVFVFNVITGLLPVFNTLRKTPAEILARNDVN